MPNVGRLWIIVGFFLFSCILCPVQHEDPLFVPANPMELKDMPEPNSDPDIDLSNLPPINYETLYAEWYSPKIEMLIITPDDQNYIDAATPLRDWKNEKGVKTVILSNFSSYSGRDKAEQIRTMIKTYYEKERVRWVLLAGDATEDLIPTRYVYNPDTVEYSGDEYGSYDEYYKPTDFYYADLTGTWDEDGDGKWGESADYNAHGVDEIDWAPDVYVGRLPASTATELEIMVNKTIAYEQAWNVGDWMNRMLLAGGISDYSPAEDETRLTTYIIQNYANTEVNYTHQTEYTTSYTPPNPKESLTQANFVSRFNQGYATVFFAAHGNPYRFFRNPSNGIAYTDSDAGACSNLNMSSLVYASACTTAPFDQNDDNIGERLIKRATTGAIGYVGSMRISWYFDNDVNLEKLNRGNAKLFWKVFYEGRKFQQGKALYDSKVAYMNSSYFDSPSVSMRLEYERKNVLTYCLLGDPEVDVYTKRPVLAKNPFVSDVNEGQWTSGTIRDVYDRVVPYARVVLNTSDGLEQTFYADNNGECAFYVPAMGNRTYNATIYGHNLIPTQFNFTAQYDEICPELTNLWLNLKYSFEDDEKVFSVNASDSISGIEKVFLLVSDNKFKNYKVYEMKNSSTDTGTSFDCFFDDLRAGNYSYLALARDKARNSKILYDDRFFFEVFEASEEPKDENEDFIAFIFFICLIGALAGISCFAGFKLYKKRNEKERAWEVPAIRIRDKEWRDKTRLQKQISKRAEQFKQKKRTKNV